MNAVTAMRAPLSALAGLALAASLAAGFAAPAQALDIQKVTSPKGQVFWMVREPAIPIVALEISFDGGARLDPQGKAGLARLTVGLLDEGAGDLNSVAFAKRRDELAARFGFDVGRDSVQVTARMLTETLDPSVKLLATALGQPRFDADAVKRVRGQLLASLAQDETDPGTVASRAWYARAFPGLPYGTPVDGTKQSVGAITRDDLIAAHKRLLSRASARIAVVGAIGPDKAGQMVDTLLAGLDRGKPNKARPVDATPPPGVKVIKLDVPQSAAIFGQTGIARNDPDFIPAFVMNYILGGGNTTSRLMQQVRVKRGLAYGVYSYLAELEAEPLYLGSVQSANAKMAESLDLIRSEWARMAKDGVTAQELQDAKRYLTGAFPLEIDSDAKIADYLIYMQIENLGIDYIDRRNALIEAVTQDDIKRVAKRLLKPDALSIVVAGKPDGL